MGFALGFGVFFCVNFGLSCRVNGAGGVRSAEFQDRIFESVAPFADVVVQPGAADAEAFGHLVLRDVASHEAIDAGGVDQRHRGRAKVDFGPH